ncbi:Apolipoprotein N-acyltransferase [hydrothermal vent metagenome]|uniref:Apolipoprotein N-acyltransferase n=1 Tax=hydrothermal vent metagenome TaxID=652676 RepID=A0A1W1EFC4_9ZZZZ
MATLSGTLALYLLLKSPKEVWFWVGFFIGIFWFWWISVSFIHYKMTWAIPIVVLALALLYGFIFLAIALLSEKISKVFSKMGWNLQKGAQKKKNPTLSVLLLRSVGLLAFSYIHPFGFDWFKPELMFVNSYFGIEKWQFAIILISITLTIWKKNFFFLFLLLLAYQNSDIKSTLETPKYMQLVNTHTTVEEKWNEKLQGNQAKNIFKTIDEAIASKKSLIIFPESIFPIYLSRNQILMSKLKERAKKISIVIGGLYWDGETPHNSTYVFTKEKLQIANKVKLVPFGESNPLPDFLSDWVNKVFYDGAVDYKASKDISDYVIDGRVYRNAICFEATSEELYEGEPKEMIVLSNNGWFTPSIEPTLQKLLLIYYSRKYGTTIYHSVNMSDSYVVQNTSLK